MPYLFRFGFTWFFALWFDMVLPELIDFACPVFLDVALHAQGSEMPGGNWSSVLCTHSRPWALISRGIPIQELRVSKGNLPT